MLTDHIPAGTTANPFVHYAQLHLTDNQFLKYDYGPEENAVRYNGSINPPPYNIEKIVTPTALFVGEVDSLGDIADNNHLAQVLPNVFHHEVIQDYGHVSFSVSYSAPEKVYKTIISYINDFENS